jgi:hypothetical protein
MAHKLRLGLCGLVLVTATQFSTNANALTSKEIYETYSHSIVKVICRSDAVPPVDISYGTGFVVSSTSLTITANHVVTLEPDRQTYCPHIVVVSHDGKEHEARPLYGGKPVPSAITHDYAVLKTEPLKLPILKLGTWRSVVPGDDLTTLGFVFGTPSPLLLTLTTSGLIEASNNNLIVFQGPNNKGLSGGPLISNQSGEVVGIVNSKIVGITDDLVAIRKQIILGQQSGDRMQILGADPLKALLDLINTLDNYLISGMGVGISIDYAKATLPAS